MEDGRARRTSGPTSPQYHIWLGMRVLLPLRRLQHSLRYRSFIDARGTLGGRRFAGDLLDYPEVCWVGSG